VVAATAASINFTGGGGGGFQQLSYFCHCIVIKKTGVLYDAAAVYLSTASPD